MQLGEQFGKWLKTLAAAVAFRGRTRKGHFLRQ